MKKFGIEGEIALGTIAVVMLHLTSKLTSAAMKKFGIEGCITLGTIVVVMLHLTSKLTSAAMKSWFGIEG